VATNRIFERGRQLSVAPTLGPNATVASGDPVAVGQLPGVALTDADDTIANGGEASVQFDGVFELEVVGTSDDGTTGAAISAGDLVYLDTDGSLNVDATNGVRFGYALEDVASGATSTIRVKVGY
jgi:predicted RecA/RadA family phage recombinase